MFDFTIKKATEADAAGIAWVHICSWKKAYQQYIPEVILNNLSLDERTQQWYGLINAGVSIFVLEVNKQVVGFASICGFRDEGEDHQGEISAIYLHPDHWHKGLGTKLCHVALDKLSELGYKEALLWVLSDNQPASKFYERLGFELTGATKLEAFYDGGALLEEVLYKKLLPS